MNKHFIRLITIFILLIGVAWWLFQRHAPSSGQPRTTPAVAPAKPNIASSAEALLQSNLPKLRGSGPIIYPLWRGGRAMTLNDPRWKIADERDKWDPSWEGKMAIEFYGKVVDERDQPVAGAKIEFGWTDLSPAGSSEKVIMSDANGLFSIAGIKGKALTAVPTKKGYETSRTQNHFGFEYASFSDEDYYEPDLSKPVIFYLRRKGIAEPLKFHEKEYKISVGRPLKIPIDGATQLQFTLLSNVHPKHGKWEAEIVLQNGGLVPATEEFIVEAPTDGYESKMTIGPQTPKPPTWEL